MAKVAILGLGTVGSGVAEVLTKNADSIARKAGEPVEVKYILGRHDYPDSPFRDLVVTDFSIIENDPEAKATFIEAMNRDAENYLKEVERLEVIHTKVLMENGASEKDAKRMASKFANEDARFLLPNACETKMVVTMNARSLHNFFAMRCCNRAQWEIHELADRMLVECKKVAPNLFLDAGPKCMFSSCQEGPMSCGKAKEVREKYKAL